MFRKSVIRLSEILPKLLREEGLETPLLQKRLIDSWETVVGETVASYTTEKFIRNQTLFVKIQSPALRADLSMIRQKLVKKLNDKVGTMVIADIRFY